MSLKPRNHRSKKIAISIAVSLALAVPIAEKLLALLKQFWKG